MLGEAVPDEVALAVLSHLDDPHDLLRVAATCRRALRLARDTQLWEVALRRSSHERAVRWCSLVLDGIPPHLARASAIASAGTHDDDDEEAVGIVEWARFFARHKRDLVACLRPHYHSEGMATALAEVLMSREFMTDWLMNQPPRNDYQENVDALAELPAQFVSDLLILPMLEAQLQSCLSKPHLTEPANNAFIKSRPPVAISLALNRLETLMATCFASLVPQLRSLVEVESDSARVTDEADQERLERACDGLLGALHSLQFPLEVRSVWSHFRSCVSRLHHAAAPPSVVDTTGSSATEQRADDDDARSVGLLAVGATAIMRVGVIGVARATADKPTQQGRNLALASRMLRVLVAIPADAGARWLASEASWQQRWLTANQHLATALLTQCSTVTDEEMVGLLRDAVRAEGESMRPAGDSRFQAGHAGVLEKHMSSYARDCLRSDGLPAHPRWLLQRLYYLFASVQFTVQLVSRTAGDREFEHVELYAMQSTRAIKMTRLSQQLPPRDGRDEWQGKVSHKRCLAAMEAPLVSGAGSKVAGEEITMGFAFRFGLFHKSPNREKRANPPVWVGVAEVATQAIMSGLPDGRIEMDVPITATTLRQFRRTDAEDTIAPKPTPPNTSATTKRAKGAGKEKSEKGGWLCGLVHKLHRSVDSKGVEEEKEEESENKKQVEENRMHVMISLVLL